MVSKQEVTGTIRSMLRILLLSSAYMGVQLIIIGICAVQVSRTGNVLKFALMMLALLSVSVMLAIAAVVLRILYVNSQTATAGVQRQPVPAVEPVAVGSTEDPAVVGTGPGAVEPTAPLPEAGAVDADSAAAST